MLNFLVNEDDEEASIHQIQNHIQSKPQQYFYDAGFPDLIKRIDYDYDLISGRSLLKIAMERLGLSARAYDRILIFFQIEILIMTARKSVNIKLPQERIIHSCPKRFGICNISSFPERNSIFRYHFEDNPLVRF